MTSDPIHPEFPNLRPEVVRGYLEAPEHMTAEVLDGELFLMNRPRLRHGRASTGLIRAVTPFDGAPGGPGASGNPGGWIFLPEPELRLGRRPDIIDPDLAGWRRERLPQEPETAFASVVPDWVCEILSDSTEAIDRSRKWRIYRREGVRHYWLLDPRAHTLEVYALVNGRWHELDTFEGNVVVRVPPFEAVELDLAALWTW